MSATPGKVLVDGVAEVGGERVFVLKLLQGRDPSWVNRIFFARYDETACWLDDLQPAFGDGQFFFTEELPEMLGEWVGDDSFDAESDGSAPELDWQSQPTGPLAF